MDIPFCEWFNHSLWWWSWEESGAVALARLYGRTFAEFEASRTCPDIPGIPLVQSEHFYVLWFRFGPIWAISTPKGQLEASPSPVSLGIGNDSAGWRQWNDGGNFCQRSAARQPRFALPMYHEGAGYFVWRTHWQLAGLCVSPCLGCEFNSARVSIPFWASYMIVDVHFYLHIGYCT